MSKKRFTEGLESLLTGPEEVSFRVGDRLAAGESSVPTKTGKGGGATEATAASEEPGKKSTGKKFASDLQSFLTEAFEESFDRQMQQTDATAAEVKKRSQKPMDGLDALIRTTIDPRVHFDAQQKMRRLTVVFDEQKLEKLKTIARMEKTYLRDIIDNIVAEYIQTYELRQGSV